MVVHIGQMSQGLLMTATDTLKPEEPTESFESVLANAGKVAAESKNTLDKKQNCAEDVKSEDSKTDDVAPEQEAETVMAAGNVVVSQMMLQTPVDTISTNVSVSDMSEVTPMEVVANTNAGAVATSENFVQFAEVETFVSEYAGVNDELVQLDAGENVTTGSLEQANPAEAEMFEMMKVSNVANQDSAQIVANDRSLLTNAKDVVEGLQNSQIVPTEDSVAVETNERTENFVLEQKGNQAKSVSTDVEVEEEFAMAAPDVQTTGSAPKSSDMRVDTRQMFVSVREQVIEQLTRNLEDVSFFRNEISFVLNPENLGKVSVKMAVENGVLTVELSAANKETQSILAANIESIKEVLKNLSTDNQVQNIMQETQPDYLQQQNEQGGGNNRHPQEENSVEQSVDDTQLTENFLTMLDMFGSEDI